MKIKEEKLSFEERDKFYKNHPIIKMIIKEMIDNVTTKKKDQTLTK